MLWYSGVMSVSEVDVIDAIRDAQGRMFSRGGENWLNTIPMDAILTLEDVCRIRQQGETIRVLMPQHYEKVVELTNEHMMFENGTDFGYFYGEHGDMTILSEQLTFDHPLIHSKQLTFDHPLVKSKSSFAVSGSGADLWYKLTDSLKQHARDWK